MKRSNLPVLMKVALIAICLFLAGTAWSEEGSPLSVGEIAICLDVVDHLCVDAGDLFPANVGKLFCFTRIQGARGDAEVSHVWYFGDTERAHVKLGVRSPNFRTYSSKIIRPQEVGLWRVEILGPAGELLTQIQFEIVP